MAQKIFNINPRQKPNKSRKKVRKIPHKGDYINYPQSNLLADRGIKPSKSRDKDQDGILDIEDCAPNNPNMQGIRSSISSAYKTIKSKFTAPTPTMTVTVTDRPAQELGGVRNVDYEPGSGKAGHRVSGG